MDIEADYLTFPGKPVQKRYVYLDHAATTPMDASVFDAMKPYLTDQFGNPSALYTLGRNAKKAMDEARSSIANSLGSQPDTIIFTSGGTESDNMALFGVAKKKKGHIITTKIEHHAVLRSCKELEKLGCEITYLDVDRNGQISLDAFKKALRDDTVLVSIMYANNEIGTILPIADIGREILKWRKQKQFHPQKGNQECVQLRMYPFFHTDACQAAGSLELNVEKLHVDLMTVNGSKMYGPKGVGVLYKRRGLELEPIIYGGGQEMAYRSGTENVAAIVGMAEALGKAHNTKSVKQEPQYKLQNSKVQVLRDYFWAQIQNTIDRVELNGAPLDGARLTNNLNVVFHGVEAEALLLYLDEYGITIGTGSACATGSDEGSHVLHAIGKPKTLIESSVRFSLGKNTTKDDIDYVMTYLPVIVKKLRNLGRKWPSNVMSE